MILIGPDDPTAADVVELLSTHLAFANAHSAPEDVHALDVAALTGPEIMFRSARNDGQLLAVGALKMLTEDHFELKSMHTDEAARGQGIGRALVEYLLDEARSAGATRVSLETGTMDAMAAARALYSRLGFIECEPFADYWVADASVCMTRTV